MDVIDKNVVCMFYEAMTPNDACRFARTCRKAHEAYRMFLARQTMPPRFEALFGGSCLSQQEQRGCYQVLLHGVLVIGWFERVLNVRGMQHSFEHAGIDARAVRLFGDEPPSRKLLERLLERETCVVFCGEGPMEEEEAELLGDALTEFACQRGRCVVMGGTRSFLRGRWSRECQVLEREHCHCAFKLGCALLPPQRLSLCARILGGQAALSRVPRFQGIATRACKTGAVTVVADVRMEVPFLAYRRAGAGCVVHVNCFMPAGIAAEGVPGGWETDKSRGVLERVFVGACAFGLLRANSLL